MPKSKNSTDAVLPELTIIDRGIYCTSLQIAENFEKEHFHVLRDIDTLLSQVAENPYKTKFGGIDDMFSKGEYEITTGIGTKVKKPMYLINRDGFMLLVMGYEGQKAMSRKLAYMNAFNLMEKKLLAGNSELLGTPVEDEPKTITSKEYHELKDMMWKVVGRLHYKESARHGLANMIRFKLNVGGVQSISPADYSKAVAMLEAAQQSANMLWEMYLELEKEFVPKFLCEGIPFTSTLRKEFTERFQRRLPPAPDWREVVRQLDAPRQ